MFVAFIELNAPVFNEEPLGRHPALTKLSFGLAQACLSGRGGGTRTPDPRFWRPMLYQLSYTPITHQWLSNCKMKIVQGFSIEK